MGILPRDSRVSTTVCLHHLDSEMLGKNRNENYTGMLHTVLKKSWKQDPIKQLLYDHLLPIKQNIQVRRARYAWYSRRSKDEFIRDIFKWTPTHGSTSVGRPAETYVYQLWASTECAVQSGGTCTGAGTQVIDCWYVVCFQFRIIKIYHDIPT